MEVNGQGQPGAARGSQSGWVSNGLETVALFWNTVLEQELGKVEREGSSLFKTSRFQPLEAPRSCWSLHGPAGKEKGGLTWMEKL